MEYIVPDGTKVKLNKDVSGHNWNAGDIVEIVNNCGIFYYCIKDGCGYDQIIMRNQFYHKDPIQ